MISAIERESSGDDAFRVDAVWDIETQDWDTFVCGALWTPEGIETYTDEDDFGARLLSLPPGYQTWAHAGGRFDTLWLIDWCFRTGRRIEARVIMSGSSVASMAVKNGPVFRDSARLLPMSLASASTMFDGAVKEKLALPCRCGKDCGGYCAIRRDMPLAQLRRVIEYLEMDVKSLRDTLTALATFCAQNEILLAGTLAGATWRTAKALAGLEDAEWNYRMYKFAREGYYGGRVEVGITEAPQVWRYDRTQAYPAAMCGPLPCGAIRAFSGRKAGMVYAHGAPGIFRARVRVPEMAIPPLPHRVAGRLAYPTGEFNGVWCRAELEHAEEVGAKVLAVVGALAWERAEPILEPYMQRCFAMREAADAPALKTWLKLLANSLSGAFAQDPESDVVQLGDYTHDGRYTQVGRSDWVWRRTTYRIPSRGHVHWAATLTTDARVELHREMRHSDRGWAYSDTDSVYATRELSRNVGHGLGLWKFEGIARDFEALAPKVYTFTTEEKGRHVRAKGVPDAKERWQALKDRQVIRIDRGVRSLLQAARGTKFFDRRHDRRQLKAATAWCGARIRDGIRTRAPSVAELKNLPR